MGHTIGSTPSIALIGAIFALLFGATSLTIAALATNWLLVLIVFVAILLAIQYVVKRKNVSWTERGIEVIAALFATIIIAVLGTWIASVASGVAPNWASATLALVFALLAGESISAAIILRGFKLEK